MAQRTSAALCCFSRRARPATARRWANFTARVYSPPRAIFSLRRAVSKRFACNLSRSAIHRPRRRGSGDATLLPHLWSLLKSEPIRCDLAFGKPLAYGRGECRKAIADEAASSIASMLTSMQRAADLLAQTGTPALEPIAANPGRR